MTISKNISGKVEDSIVEAIELIDAIAKQHGIQYFIVGAKARDIFFSAIYDIDTDMNRSYGSFQGEYFKSTRQLLQQLKRGML